MLLQCINGKIWLFRSDADEVGNLSPQRFLVQAFDVLADTFFQWAVHKEFHEAFADDISGHASVFPIGRNYRNENEIDAPSLFHGQLGHAPVLSTNNLSREA